MDRTEATVPRRRRLRVAAVAGLAAVVLFLIYVRVSSTQPVNSDDSSTMMMAWAMLHGNVLLHGWWMSDVSFYTTELPQYALLEGLLGLHPHTAHVAAAMTYTLVVLRARLPSQPAARARPRLNQPTPYWRKIYNWRLRGPVD